MSIYTLLSNKKQSPEALSQVPGKTLLQPGKIRLYKCHTNTLNILDILSSTPNITHIAYTTALQHYTVVIIA